MKNRNLLFFYTLALILAFGCSSQSKIKKNSIKKSVTICDTISNYILKNYNSLKPDLLNLDPDRQNFLVKNATVDCYQIEFKKIDIFNIYEINFDTIKFVIDLNLSNPNYYIVGDKVVCFINQQELGRKCVNMISKNEEIKNIYQCIYDHSWTVKVRGLACSNYYGPYSEELKNLSFQCTEN